MTDRDRRYNVSAKGQAREARRRASPRRKAWERAYLVVRRARAAAKRHQTATQSDPDDSTPTTLSPTPSFQRE